MRERDGRETVSGPSLEGEAKEIVGMLNSLYDTLARLRFEGKPGWSDNLRKTKHSMKRLKVMLGRQINLEDKILFPAFLTSLPRLESAVAFLRADHQTAVRSLDHLEDLIRHLRVSGDGKAPAETIDEIFKTGTYFIYLLRSHWGVGLHDLCRSARKWLRPREIGAIKNRMAAA